MSKTDELLKTIACVKEAVIEVFEEWRAEALIANLDEIADIVKAHGEIVHCGECEIWDKDISFMDAHACPHWSPSREHPRLTQPNDFCSYGKRKEAIQ